MLRGCVGGGMGVGMDEVDHVWAFSYARRTGGSAKYGAAVRNLARAYLELAPDPDADLIDSDPLPEGWFIESEVAGRCIVSCANGRIIYSPSRKDAVRRAWGIHHDTP